MVDRFHSDNDVHLPQPVDMRLKRVSGDAGIVAPDFLQQHFATGRWLAR
jgi:hypothetical protein